MKEHYSKRLKREKLLAEQKLFKVCNFPDDDDAKQIIIEQKYLAHTGKLSFAKNILTTTLTHFPFYHYEES